MKGFLLLLAASATDPVSDRVIVRFGEEPIEIVCAKSAMQSVKIDRELTSTKREVDRLIALRKASGLVAAENLQLILFRFRHTELEQELAINQFGSYYCTHLDERGDLDEIDLESLLMPK